jgi:putative membrane protein
MKLSTASQISVAAIAFSVATAAVAQNPRQVPPVPQQSPQAKMSANASSGKAQGTLTAQDRDFMKKAADGGMKEVEMGRMGEQQGKSAEVKAFGKRMVADHSKANSELMAIAAKKGVKLSNRAPKMAKMNGGNFDKDYMAAMVKDHEQDLAEFQREASGGGDPEVKAFAAKTAKVVEKHLALAKSNQAKLK